MHTNINKYIHTYIHVIYDNYCLNILLVLLPQWNIPEGVDLTDHILTMIAVEGSSKHPILFVLPVIQEPYIHTCTCT